MNVLVNVFDNIKSSYENPAVYGTTILSVIVVVFVLSVYEYIVYRLISHRSFYNKSFNICLSMIPFFISTIILCLQSNIVITLGTIGALAIIRFRTAIKDPVDMVYILWAVHIGITCGCQLYEVAVLTSLAVTIVLFLMENISIGKRPLVLILHCPDELETKVLMAIKQYSKTYKIKSKNFSSKGIDFVIELSVGNMSELTDEIKGLGVEKFSILQYDCDDIV